MYHTKPLVPFWDDDDIHFRGKGDSNDNDAVKFIGEFDPKWASESETMGYSKLPTLCGTKVSSKQSVLARFSRDEVCDECLEIIEENGLTIDEFIED